MMLATERMAESALHRMSQPLTAMLCLLEFGLEQEQAEVLREFSQRSLAECERMVAMMNAFREMLQMGTSAEKTEAIELQELLGWMDESLVIGAMETGQRETGQQETGKTQLMTSIGTGHVVVRVNRSAMETVIWNLNGVLGAYECGQVYSREASDDLVRLRWELTGGNTAAWKEELEAINPFTVAGYDFAVKGIPRLTVVKTLAEAMGGDMLCDGHSLELRLKRVVA